MFSCLVGVRDSVSVRFRVWTGVRIGVGVRARIDRKALGEDMHHDGACRVSCDA